MTTLNVTLLNEKATMPDMLGSVVLLPLLDAHLDVIQRAGEKPAQAYWINTGLSFNVPDGHVLKIYPAPVIAQNNLARLADGVTVVLPGDRKEVVLRMVVDHGGKTFKPTPGMVIAHGMLEAVITPKLVEEKSTSPESEKTVVPASENVEPEKDTQRTKKAK